MDGRVGAPLDDASATRRILVVDDDLSVLAAVARSLRRTFEVHTAEGGEAALECLAANGPFAIVMSDMRMPGMDGLELISEVRRVAPDTVRMLLTGQTEMDPVIDAIESGLLFRCLAKPCRPEELREALEAAFERYRLARAERE